MTTRRNYLKSSVGILGVTTLGGCLQGDTLPQVKWLESGVQKVKLDDLISLSAYLEGINQSKDTETIFVGMRLVKKDNTILSDWTNVSAEDIPAGRKFSISANFEVSRASVLAPNDDLMEVKNGVDIIFTQIEDWVENIEEDDPIKKIVDGEVEYYRKPPSSQSKDTDPNNSTFQNYNY